MKTIDERKEERKSFFRSSMCAWTLAHAHAKTGDRHAIAGYLGNIQSSPLVNESFNLQQYHEKDLFL